MRIKSVFILLVISFAIHFPIAGGGYCEQSFASPQALSPSRITPILDLLLSSDPTEDSYTFDVQWTDQTTLIDKNHLGLLTHRNPAMRQYTFDAAAISAAGLNLTEGRVLIVHGIAFGRIVSSSTIGNDLVVTLEPATLGDAIREGTIAWDFAVPFTTDRVQVVDPNTGMVLNGISSDRAMVLSDDVVASAAASGPFEITFKNGPFDYTIKINFGGEAADCDITVKKELASNIVSTYAIKSHLEKFRSQNQLKIVNGQLVSSDHNIDKLKSEVTVELIVAGSGNDLNYQLPVTIMKVPFLIGPIPASLNIIVRFVVNAVVPIDGTARVDSKFTYDSDLGFNYSGSQVNWKAQVGAYTIDDSTTMPYAASSAQMSASFGVGFPEIRLVIGEGIEAATWLRTAFIIGASFTAYNTLIPVCLQANAEFLGAAGYDMSIFGFETDLFKGSRTLFDYKKPLRRSGQCPP